VIFIQEGNFLRGYQLGKTEPDLILELKKRPTVTDPDPVPTWDAVVPTQPPLEETPDEP
jgi:hypothetical protein